MFSGIVEAMGVVTRLTKEKDNLHISITCFFTHELKVDQSIAHNGVCLTVVDIKDKEYTVTAIKETLNKSNLGQIKVGDKINLERSLMFNDRLDGHMVQGHVDQTAICERVEEENGSWLYHFSYSSNADNITVEKGSISVNGVSLTVVNSKPNGFSVAIIPYTYDNTNFHTFQKGSMVNLEFDIIGKYVSRLLALHK